MTAQSTNPAREKSYMDNSGDGPLRVPGFGNIPLDYELPSQDRFAHGHDEWYQVPVVTIRELAMVAAMNVVTDKCNWHVGVFDDVIVGSWRKDAEAAFPRLSGPDWPEEVQDRVLLSQKAWEWCLLELRDKAEAFKQKHFVRVLDTGSCVCKSDTLVPTSCADELKSSLSEFYDQPPSERLTPQRDGSLYIVDPCLYPLVYGQTPVLQGGQTLELNSGVEGYVHTELAPKHEQVEVDPSIQQYIDEGPANRWILSVRSQTPWSAYRWSSNFQWLPCEVEFVEQTGRKVRISSCINNLHPKHAAVYSSLESLLARSIGMWNDCLVKGINIPEPGRLSNGRHGNDQRQRGRVPLRIVSYGIHSGPRIPDWAIHFDENKYKTGVDNYLKAKGFVDGFPADADASLRSKRRKALALINRWAVDSGTESPPERVPSPTPEQWEMARQFLESRELGGQTLPINWKDNAFQHIQSRVESVERWDYPEPGDAVSYADWRAGIDTHRAIVEKASAPRDPDNDQYSPCDALYESYTVQLEDKFRGEGLQVIVKIGGIEASPHAPEQVFDETYERWQVAGRLNEHIVATAVYVYDVANVQECHIEFRQVSRVNRDCYRCSEKAPGGRLRKMFFPTSEREDVVLSMLNIKHRDVCPSCNMSGTPAFQKVGEISMPEGRLFAFPDVMEHRFAPLQLVDETLPGHCRFVTLHLVDPHYRICSTRNVPPQQHEWWSDEVSDFFVSTGLPRELTNQICSAVDDWPMGEEEALLHRHQQLLERKPMDIARWRGAGIL